MLIREAVRLSREASVSDSRKVALVCSFEPLHLKTYLQAFLVERVPDAPPEVVSFGYDHLLSGLAETSSVLKIHPVLLCLSWEDLHPALSWRSRSLAPPDPADLEREGRRLAAVLEEWMAARSVAETYVALPPLEFLPHVDSGAPSHLGPRAVKAAAMLWDLALQLSTAGARLLAHPRAELNFRDLLLSGCPLTTEGSELLARRFVDAAFRRRARKKALVLDLDGTLWDGVIGEDGIEGIACRPEGKGYPFHVFQQFVLKLKREGVLLAFCSKNNAADVLPNFDTLELPLKLADFSAYRCDWEPKSVNVRAIADELNIGCDAIVVVDDDAAELAEIGRAVPEAAAYKTPRGGREWRQLLADLQDEFATWAVTETDALRTGSVVSHRARRANLAVKHGDDLAHLREMNLEVKVERAAFTDPRSLELINKTNQFNLTGERFAQDHWLAWTAQPGAFCWSARLKDRFGDFGTIAVVAGHASEEAIVHVRQFVVSCRAFGRGVEAIVLGVLAAHYNAVAIQGPLRLTGKNEPARKFLAALGCDADAPGEWRVTSDTAARLYRRVLAQTQATVVATLKADDA